jgi:site-specific DNA-methyltransferase (adenine-specific)
LKNDPLPRLDASCEIRSRLLPCCRLIPGRIWIDPEGRHRVACGDAGNAEVVAALAENDRATLAIHDPPYNLVAFQKRSVDEFIEWCRGWIGLTEAVLTDNSALYVWLGADQNRHFQPLPQFMLMMQDTGFQSRSLITMRNQRGHGTQTNWMAVRQELLYYTKGRPSFEVQYTDIPKILRGYYKDVGGETMENFERSKSDTIRPGNVWVDIQQVFYRMQENVSGCYAQKPLKAIERIVKASSQPGDFVLDFFAHSGTTAVACELHGRRCLTMDLDPIFCEITIRRLEHYRKTGETGWQNSNAFDTEITLPEPQ